MQTASCGILDQILTVLSTTSFYGDVLAESRFSRRYSYMARRLIIDGHNLTDPSTELAIFESRLKLERLIY